MPSKLSRFVHRLIAGIAFSGIALHDWAAVNELNLSYCIGETLLFTIYTRYGNLT